MKPHTLVCNRTDQVANIQTGKSVPSLWCSELNQMNSLLTGSSLTLHDNIHFYEDLQDSIEFVSVQKAF